MPIITISRGSYSQGREVAELVADKLGYSCLARDVVIEASKDYDVPEVKLTHAIDDPPSIFDRLSHGKEHYISYLRAALLRHFQHDKVVYHGLLGHYFLPGISHVINVRVLADPELRAAVVMKRDGVSRREAGKILEQSDEGRRRWAMHLYGVDPADPDLYHLVVHVGRVSAEYAADMICKMAELPEFQPTKSSQAKIDDLALAADVEAILVKHLPGVEVSAKDGQVEVTVQGARIRAGTPAESLIMAEIGRRFPGDPRVDLFFAETAINEGNREEARRRLESLIAKLPEAADDHAEGIKVKRVAAARLRELDAR